MKFKALLVTIFICTVFSDPECRNVQSDPCACISTATETACFEITSSSQMHEIFESKAAATVDSISVTESSVLTSLPARAFGDVKFKGLYVAKTGLTSVDNNAFQGSENVAETIVLNHNHFSDFNFQSIRSLTKLNGFGLTNDHLTRIPQGAFSNLPYLQYVDLTNNSITSIQPDAFANSRSLIRIDLRGNKIATIEENTFNIPNTNNRVLINLNSNEITTIHKNAFKDLKIKNLELENNKLETLDQETFEPVVEYLKNLNSEPGVIHLKGNPIKCDSTLRWLVVKPSTYKSRVANLRCPNGKTLSQLTEDDLH